MKRPFLLLAAAACILLLTGAARRGTTVLLIGDSITDGGWGRSGGLMKPSAERNHRDLNHLYGSGYMYLCAAHYQAAYPQKGYLFYNRGISGNTLADLQQRWEEDALALRPDVLSLLVGTNDIQQWLDGDRQRPFDFEAWERDYRRLLDEARRRNPDLRLLLGAPFVAPSGRVGESPDYPLRDSLVGVLARIVERIAADCGAAYLPYDAMFDALQRTMPDSLNGYWIWDGIHPTAAGHRKMADLWIEAFDRLEQQQPGRH